VKQAMATGRTVILVNHDAIYESLYDVLNQRYVTRVDSDTGVRNVYTMLPLFITNQCIRIDIIPSLFVSAIPTEMPIENQADAALGAWPSISIV
jgi:hypothetical protein